MNQQLLHAGITMHGFKLQQVAKHIGDTIHRLIKEGHRSSGCTLETRQPLGTVAEQQHHGSVA